MAAADYMLCALCNRKTYYDSGVDYPDDIEVMALCSECCKTHMVKIESRSLTPTPAPAADVAAYQSLCAALYAGLGQFGVSEKVLDLLLAGAEGEVLDQSKIDALLPMDGPAADAVGSTTTVSSAWLEQLRSEFLELGDKNRTLIAEVERLTGELVAEKFAANQLVKLGVARHEEINQLRATLTAREAELARVRKDAEYWQEMYQRAHAALASQPTGDKA